MRPSSLAVALAAAALLLAPAELRALSLGPGAWSQALDRAAETFETARPDGRAVQVRGLRFSPLSPGELAPGVPAGGALELALACGLGGDGQAVSTRPLAWPYGFVLELDRPAAALSLAWLGANADWRVTAQDDRGATIGQVTMPGFEPAASPVSGGAGAPQARLTLALGPEDDARGGIARLTFESLGDYDWLFLDDLRAVPDAERPRAPAGALRLSAAAPASPVPLPAPLALLGAALGGLAWLRPRRSRRPA